MSDKYWWYFMHTLIIAGCIASIIMAGIGAVLPCLFALWINKRFKERCLGFYYGRRENIAVDIVNAQDITDVNWELVDKENSNER